jgi:hypothetical protein
MGLPAESRFFWNHYAYCRVVGKEWDFSGTQTISPPRCHPQSAAIQRDIKGGYCSMDENLTTSRQFEQFEYFYKKIHSLGSWKQFYADSLTT